MGKWPLHLAEAGQGNAAAGTPIPGGGGPVGDIPGGVACTLPLMPPLETTVEML